MPVIERLAQNLYICPSTIAQYAALACFEPDSLAEYERRRAEFKARRDWFIPALNALGLNVPVMPDGAFYAWADCTQACQTTGREGQLGTELCADAARPRGRHAGARLRQRRDAQVHPLLHGECPAPAAGRRGAAAQAPDLKQPA